jgi:Tfp pilus assembly protein PilX
MENIHKITPKKLEAGMVLIFTMLFLLIISCIAASIFNTSLLETKMSAYYQSKMQAFYKAENQLKKYENELINNKHLTNSIIIDTDNCGAIFYQITSTVEYNNAISKLQSTFVTLAANNTCQNITEGRQSFLISQ